MNYSNYNTICKKGQQELAISCEKIINANARKIAGSCAFACKLLCAVAQNEQGKKTDSDYAGSFLASHLITVNAFDWECRMPLPVAFAFCCENFKKSLAKEHILCYNHTVSIYVAYFAHFLQTYHPGKEDNFMDSLKKYLPTILLIAGVVCLLIAVVIAVVTITGWSGTHGLINVLLMFAAVLFLALGGLVMYLAVITTTVTKHFFLYDKNTGKNIRPSELVFETVNKRMCYVVCILLRDCIKQE